VVTDPAAAARPSTREERRLAGRNPQTHAKRARELAVKERRERKRAKKAEAAAQRAAGADDATAGDGDGDAADSPDVDGRDEGTSELGPE